MLVIVGLRLLLCQGADRHEEREKQAAASKRGGHPAFLTHPSRLNAVSRDFLNPLAPPGRCLEGIREILCLVHNLTVAELHNAHCVCWSTLVGDGVLRDPEITFSENSLDVEA